MNRRILRSLVAAAATVVAALGLAAPGAATEPAREVFAYSYSFVDTSTCGFPVVGEFDFTNMIIDRTVATGTGTLALHQSNVGTLTANGVTLVEDDHYTISIEFLDGVPTTATWTGQLDSIRGQNFVFHRTGQAVYEVVFDPVLGFYVDGPLVTRHGLRDDFDAAAVCAAFS
jgi:hypothetical protein